MGIFSVQLMMSAYFFFSLYCKVDELYIQRKGKRMYQFKPKWIDDFYILNKHHFLGQYLELIFEISLGAILISNFVKYPKWLTYVLILYGFAYFMIGVMKYMTKAGVIGALQNFIIFMVYICVTILLLFQKGIDSTIALLICSIVIFAFIYAGYTTPRKATKSNIYFICFVLLLGYYLIGALMGTYLYTEAHAEQKIAHQELVKYQADENHESIIDSTVFLIKAANKAFIIGIKECDITNMTNTDNDKRNFIIIIGSFITMIYQAFLVTLIIETILNRSENSRTRTEVSHKFRELPVLNGSKKLRIRAKKYKK